MAQGDGGWGDVGDLLGRLAWEAAFRRNVVVRLLDGVAGCTVRQLRRWLDEHRASVGMDQKTIAEKLQQQFGLSVNRATIGRWINGDVEVSLADFLRVAEVVGLPTGGASAKDLFQEVRSRVNGLNEQIGEINRREGRPGDRLRAICEERMARALGVDHTQVSRWLDAKSECSLDNLCRLAHVLGFDILTLEPFRWCEPPDREGQLEEAYMEATRYVLDHFAFKRRRLTIGTVQALGRWLNQPDPPPIPSAGEPPIKMDVGSSAETVDLYPEHILAYFAVIRVVDQHESLLPDYPGPYDL